MTTKKDKLTEMYYLFSNEIKNTTDLNGNMIKKISSGGDIIVARENFGCGSSR